MQRRTLLKMAALSGLFGSHAPHLLAYGETERAAPVPVHTVLLATMCHLDVGFSQTQAKVIREYFDVYFPAAIKTAADLRVAGHDRYTWTTGSWLLYEYLEQADASQRRAMEQAIAARDIAWHGLPFNWQTEMLDRSMIDGAMGFSAFLDKRFGVKTTGSKMSDVPGHSRGIIAPLQDAGIRLLDVGVNAASTPPDVPDVFLWKEPHGQTLAVLYHRHDYGSVVEIPGSGVAVDVEVRGDNSGPHTPAEIAAIYAKLRKQYPDADIKAATMNDIAAAIDKVRDALPVVTSEIGDTWIYGCASDPYKVARYRSVARLRKSWVEQGKFAAGDATDRNLLQRLLLAPEHTWGTDTKRYLDYDHYRPADLAKVLDQPGYVVMETSWKEKRDDIDQAVATLTGELRAQVEDDWKGLAAVRPETASMESHDVTTPVETKHYTIKFDPETGAIVGLKNRRSGQEWASAQHPLGLFTYQTLSPAEYASFLSRYITVKTDWAPKDFGKPGIQNFGAQAREWHPRVVGCWTSKNEHEDRIVLELAIDDAEALATGNVAWPKGIFMELRLPMREAQCDVRVTTLGKLQNRMPEAMWLTFAPALVVPAAWEVEKVNQMISVMDVVRGGGRAMHAVDAAVRGQTSDGQRFEVRTLDAPVVALGDRSPLNFSFQLPDLSKGVHFCLYNNAWGTNYPQWCGGDWLARFQVFA